MLRYSKSTDQEHTAPHTMGLNGLLDALADVTLENGRGREVVAPDWLSAAVAAGRGEALTHLAGLHLGALRNGQGLTEAKPLLRQAAENGYAPAQEQLGIINLVGLGCEADPSEAAGWLRLAADQGKVGAQSLLGMMLAVGVGIAQDLPEARRLIALADAQGDGYARLGLHAASDLGLMPQLAACSLGLLRVLASVMSGLPDDAGGEGVQRGITVLADAGDADACLVLCTQNYSAGDRAAALRWCLAAAGAGSQLAVLIVGLLAFTDQEGIRGKYPAAEWLATAARQGSAPAQGLLGLMCVTGRGAARDVPEGNRLLGEAAKGMDPSNELGRFFGSPERRPHLERIMHLLGMVLAAQLYGDGSVPSDGPLNFMREVMRLAEQGDHFAQFFVGLALWSGQDLEQNRAAALRWIEEAASQGDKDAQYFLGVCFDTGNGVERDRANAIRWFSQAAEQGHAAAQFVLATACMRGDGVEKDKAESARWMRLAAEQGDVNAQYLHGTALLDGEEVERDVSAGLSWLLKAAQQGSQEARDVLKDIL